MILSVDPGQHIGIAYWKNDGTILYNKIVDIDNLMSICANFVREGGLDTIVVEQYILDHRAGRQQGSKVEASQVIGAMRLLAEQTGAQLVMQPNTILRITAQHMQVKIPAKGHIPDDVAALLHGYRYFIDHGIIKVRPGPVD